MTTLAPAVAENRSGLTEDFVRDVAAGLRSSPKMLPSRYLYDDLGSALFEAICELPWYTVTRAERDLLARHAAAICADLGDVPAVVELGAGNGEKLSLLIASAGRVLGSATVHVIDASPAALRRSVITLGQHPGLTVTPHEATYGTGVATVIPRVHGAGRTLVLFLGSNIGNMLPDAATHFLRAIRRACRPGDRLLLGTDLVKPAEELLPAYADPIGVTAAFNKNLLVRINRELDGDFAVDQFDHEVVWNADAGRVEMYLVSRGEQHVCLRAAGCCVTFADGEALWTENSHKYEQAQLADMASQAGFAVRGQWVDTPRRYALTLFDASTGGSP